MLEKTIGILSLVAVLSVLCMNFYGSSGYSSNAAVSSQKGSESKSSLEAVEKDNVESQGEMSRKSGGKSANTLILTVNSSPVYWPEFLFWLNFIGKYYKNSYGYDEITDWNAEQNGMSLRDFFLSTAVGYACKDRAIEAKAKELGIELSKDDLAEIEEKRRSNIKIYGSESEYLRIVRRMYVSEDVFNYLSKIDYLGNYIFEYLYGANGEKYSDKDVLACIDKEGYMCAKYIFLSNTGDEDIELNEEERGEKYRLLEDIIDRLDASDDYLNLFVELMNKYCEDTTIMQYPDGRLFVPGVMGKKFESACSGLKENEYSGIVKTDKGYYVILRMPIIPDMTADLAGKSLRYRIAYESFKKEVENWSGEMEIEYKEAYYDIDVEGILK